MMPAEREIGYADAASVYWDKGWRGVLPLNRGSKWPPPKGFTGYQGVDPSFADLMQWSELYPDGNVCLRLPDGVIGIDVDAYGAKTGAEAFAEAQRRWGELPDGPQSSSRDEDLTSGLRLFRVPLGTLLEDVIVFPEMQIGDIEVIQRHHRYVVCWPSIHPEGRGYWWRNSKGQLLGVPEYGEIPDLPLAWLDGLKMTPRSLSLGSEAYDVRKALTEGEPSPVVAARVNQAIKEVNLPGMSRHDTCLRHVLAILRLGSEGQPGVDNALMLLREVFIAVAAIPPGARTREEAFDEFNRMVTNDNAARELAQPGILDWFKNVMAGVAERNTPDAGDDPGAESANASQADAGAVVPFGPVTANSEPPDPTPAGELERLEQDFWTVRRQHEVIYTAALGQLASPWAVLACCAARALALVSPTITLPSIIGGRGSLNWFAAIVAESGGGKGSAMEVSRRLVPYGVNDRSIGSGEGMIECYNRAPGKGDDPPPPVISVMFEVPEIDTVNAMQNRSGQTTMSILRQGFSGEKLSISYRSRQSEAVLAHSYRMTVIAMVQPDRAGALLDDSGGGTPQRFMWFPAADKRVVEDEDEFPWPLDGLGLPLTLQTNFPSDLELANTVGSVSVPAEVVREIRRAAVARARGESDALDGHIMFAQEKLAFALAFMDQRTEINLEDWRLAGIAASVSNWWRTKTVDKYRSCKVDEHRDRGQLKGVEAAAAELGKAQEQKSAAQRVVNNVVDKIKRSMPDGITTGELNRRIAARDRYLLQGALDYLVSQETIMQRDGTTIWVTR